MTVPASWARVPADSPFGVQTLPYGVFSPAGGSGGPPLAGEYPKADGRAPRIGVRIGDQVLDVAPLASRERPELADVLGAPTLDRLLALGRPGWTAIRTWLTGLLTSAEREAAVSPHLLPVSDVRMHLPFTVADYVDFYSSEHHATNVGRMFRPDAAPLLPNWKHLPVGYHGRAGTVVVSGTDVIRPSGQRKAPDDSAPSYGPSRRLDIEAEVGFVVGVPSQLGTAVPASAFADHVFGVCLVNDWSARDIQNWEYVPLGPFLGKSFATSVSPWIVPLEALQHARTAPPERTVPLLDYLADDPDEPWGLDISLEVRWNGDVVTRPAFSTMYWTPAQQLAHLTVNGASLRTGDLYASGTVSGPQREQRGSFLELSWSGAEPIRLTDGSLRTFLEDGDEVTITATAPGPGGTRIGFGAVTGRVVPAR